MAVPLRRPVRIEPATRPSMLAALWGIVFAIPHIVWGLGWWQEALRFSLGLRVGPEEERVINDPGFILSSLWGVAALSLAACGIALSTVQPWGRRLPQWMPVAGAWGVALVLAIRGLVFPGILGGLAIEADLIPLGDDSDPAWNRWNIVLWSPWFLLGSVLFVGAARHAAIEAKST